MILYGTRPDPIDRPSPTPPSDGVSDWAVGITLLLLVVAAGVGAWAAGWVG